MNEKLIKNHTKKRGKSAEWTLNQNQDYLKQLFLSPKKKLQEVIG